MKKLVTFLILSMAVLSLSAQDLIVTANKDTIHCQIVRIDSVSVEYQVVKNGIREKNTLPRRYVTDFKMAERDQHMNHANTSKSTPHFSRFRWSVAPGYAYRLGKNPESSGYTQLDRMYKRLRNCFSWETEIQYYFNRGNGIALNISGTHSSVSERNVTIPEYGLVSCKLSQQTIYIGPAWATRYENDNFLFSGCISLGPLFYTETQMLDNSSIKMTAVSFGMNCGIGGEYKLSSNWAMGLKIGYTFSAVSSFKMDGHTYTTKEPVSLSSLFIAAYFSFRK